MNKKHNAGINIGTSSILVTFVLLALVTFASLSYMSARSDYTLSCEAAKRTASYYDANRMAELYMANIEGLLAKHSERATTEDEYYDGIDKLFSDNDRINVVHEDDKVLLEYSVVVTEGQNLEVVLSVNYPTDADSSLFHIKKWTTAINEEWLNDIKKKDETENGLKLLFQ